MQPMQRKLGRSSRLTAEGTTDVSTSDPYTGLDSQDGSKYWGHMAREKGRYGSHPTFDAHGDETLPD
jgi:hypothetical protein